MTPLWRECTEFRFPTHISMRCENTDPNLRNRLIAYRAVWWGRLPSSFSDLLLLEIPKLTEAPLS